jgi:hypothetical protein
MTDHSRLSLATDLGMFYVEGYLLGSISNATKLHLFHVPGFQTSDPRRVCCGLLSMRNIKYTIFIFCGYL